MKIDSANIHMTSQRSAVERHTVRESLRIWVGDQRPDFEGNSSRQLTPAGSVRISPEARAAANAETTKGTELGEGLVSNELRYQLLIKMIEALTGRKLRLLTIDEAPAQNTPPPDIPDPNQATRQAAGFGVEYDRHESRYEAERVQFNATGVVKTADGREIHFDLTLLMQREHFEESNTSLRTGDAVRKQDPLVINFDGTAAQLTDSKFAFDLDGDGNPESVSFVGSGSGFLVLDKNRDGKVNDGSELFGPATGNGFLELAAYDQDGNGWIDENDAVYQQLRIWTRDADGNDSLNTLAEKGVGAIGLAHIGTQFDLRNADNRLDGEVRSTGIYLREDGGAGTVQQIDLIA